MIAIYVIVLFVAVAAIIILVGHRLYVKPAQFGERLTAAVTAGQQEGLVGVDAPGPVLEQGWMVRVVQTIGEKVPISPQDASLARRYLIAAGYRSDRAVRIYYGLKILGAILFTFGGITLYSRMDNAMRGLVLMVASPGAGFFAPNIILERLVTRRQNTIRLSLPDALDLLVVCMEAGLGLDQAISNVSRELRNSYPDISEELGLVTLEMRAGKRRQDALKNLGERTGEPELKKLIATMVQSDRFGTSVADSLRTHSDFLRVKRRQEAEERAAKVGVKLVFPIFMFILPAMMVVAAGPGLLQLFKGLFPLMQGFK